VVWGWYGGGDDCYSDDKAAVLVLDNNRQSVSLGLEFCATLKYALCLVPFTAGLCVGCVMFIPRHSTCCTSKLTRKCKLTHFSFAFTGLL
jgi:hypothetical protein